MWGLGVQTTAIVFFAYCARFFHDKLQKSKTFCGNYVAKLFSTIDSTMAQNMKACRALKNIIFKVYALHNNERKKELGCLQHQEKLSY